MSERSVLNLNIPYIERFTSSFNTVDSPLLQNYECVLPSLLGRLEFVLAAVEFASFFLKKSQVALLFE